jgi:hypothetical protein
MRGGRKGLSQAAALAPTPPQQIFEKSRSKEIPKRRKYATY